MGSIVLALQVAKRRRGTINYSAQELHNVRTAHNSKVSQRLRQRRGGYDAARVGWKVIVIVTIHNVMLGLRPNGVGGRHLRRTLWARFGIIYYQGSINGPDLEGTVEFEFKMNYKLQRDAQQTTLGHLRIELFHIQRFMNPNLFNLLNSKALFEHLLEPFRDLLNNNMATFEEAMDIGEMSTEEVE